MASTPTMSGSGFWRAVLARAVTVVHQWSTPKTPSADEYFGNGSSSVGWWKAL